MKYIVSYFASLTGSVLLGGVSLAHAGMEKSGQASMEMVAENVGYEASRPVRVALHMKIDPHWHTYWENPGEGGMKLQIEWQNLPIGWKAGEIGYPVPKRMKTGDLPGFGYEGEVWFPIELTAGTTTGPVELVAKVSWLTCSDDACIPGDVSLKVDLKSGAEAGARAAEVAKAFSAVPQPWTGAKLAMEEIEAGKKVRLKLTPPEGKDVDLSSSEVFPATESALDPGTPIVFKREGTVWVAEAKKSEYATDALKNLRLVLSGGALTAPVSVAIP